MVVTLNAPARFNRPRKRLGGKEGAPPRRTGCGSGRTLRQSDDRHLRSNHTPGALDCVMGLEAIRPPAVLTPRGDHDPEAESPARQVRVAADIIIEHLSRIAFANISELFDQSDRILPLSSIPPSILPAIASYTVRRVRSRNDGGEVFAVRLHSKLRALNALARHLGMYRKDQSLDHRTQ